MATVRAKQRIQVGSAPWISEERSSANAIVETEAEEFGFSVRNDLDWLNEHMAEIFSENQMYADITNIDGSADFAGTVMLQRSSRLLESYAARHLEQREKQTR